MPGGWKTLLGISLDFWAHNIPCRRSGAQTPFCICGTSWTEGVMVRDHSFLVTCLAVLRFWTHHPKPLWFFLESGMLIPIFWRQTDVFHPCRSRATGIAAFWSTTALKRRWAAAGSPKQSVNGKANQVSCAERDVDQHFRTLNTLVSCS